MIFRLQKKLLLSAAYLLLHTVYKNYNSEVHHSGSATITQIPGVINPSNIFTKEMCNTTHFRHLRDSMMVSKSIFLENNHTVPHIVSLDYIFPYYSPCLRTPGDHKTQLIRPYKASQHHESNPFFFSGVFFRFLGFLSSLFPEFSPTIFLTVLMQGG